MLHGAADPVLAYSLDPPPSLLLLFYTHERGRGQGRVVRTIGA